MVGCVKQLQAYIVVSKALPQYGSGLLPTSHHQNTKNPYNVEKQQQSYLMRYIHSTLKI